tara:strand:- start:24 stop:227 length:204 start_codon:yes stop_codon:yes gene_type:complete
MNSKKTDIKRSNEENDRTIAEALLAMGKVRLDMADEMYRGMDSRQVFDMLEGVTINHVLLMEGDDDE